MEAVEDVLASSSERLRVSRENLEHMQKLLVETRKRLEHSKQALERSDKAIVHLSKLSPGYTFADKRRPHSTRMTGGDAQPRVNAMHHRSGDARQHRGRATTSL